jgi:LPS export ABC transporter protein LptC/lipopolysaccharide transport protein LptA
MAILVFGVAFAVAIGYILRHPKTPTAPSAGVERVDPRAAVESTGGQMLRLEGGKEAGFVDYERMVTYPDGRQRLSGVKFFVPNRQGRDFTITSKEADVAHDQVRVDLDGDVRLLASDGMTMSTPSATYDRSGGVVTAKGHVAFERERLSGTSVGMIYEDGRGLLRLLQQVALTLAGASPGESPVDVRAGTAFFPRPDHYMRYEQGFRLEHGGRLFESDLATAYLSEDESRIEMLEMRGHSRITGFSGQAGSLRGMTGQDMNLELAQDGRTLTSAIVSRDATMTLAGSGTGDRELTAGWISIGLGPDGATLTTLTAREHVRLTLPQDGASPARTITAENLTAHGESGQGVQAANFAGAVEYRERRPPAGGKPAADRLARSRVLDLTVQPGFGAVDDARFSGAVRFEEDTIRAYAGLARYRARDGVLELEGTDDTTGRKPRVSNNQVTIEGQQVQVTMEGQKISARQDVRSEMLATTDDNAGGGASSSAKRPSMLASDRPVYATSDAMTYDGTARVAAYDGRARLWQGDTAIQGDTLTIDDSTGNLLSHGHVRSTYMLEQVDDKTKKTDRVQSIATADDLIYDEATHRATYTGDAHVSGPQGDLRGAKIELYLMASGRELERVEGYEKVTLQSDVRNATGDRLTYYAKDGRYVMVGTPVRIVADCRETEGRTLTFYKATDTISVDGDDEVRTQTKGGPGCGEAKVK